MTLPVLEQEAHIIIQYRMRVLRIMLVNGELGTIVPVQAIFRGNPNNALAILINLVDETIGEFQVHRKQFPGLCLCRVEYPKEQKEKYILYFH